MRGQSRAVEGAIRVVLADDDESYLESLRALIDGQPELSVVGTAVDGIELVELVDRIDPDAVVIDLHMPRLDGIAALRRLRGLHPRLCLIALTGDGDRALHARAESAGADGVLMKDQMLEGLVERLSGVRAA